MKTLLIAIALLLTGCAGVSGIYGDTAFTKLVAIGMTKPEVIQAIGPPNAGVHADEDKKEERLTYRRMAHITGWSMTTYDVVLKNGKVMSYGEQPGQ